MATSGAGWGRTGCGTPPPPPPPPQQPPPWLWGGGPGLAGEPEAAEQARPVLVLPSAHLPASPLAQPRPRGLRWPAAGRGSSSPVVGDHAPPLRQIAGAGGGGRSRGLAPWTAGRRGDHRHPHAPEALRGPASWGAAPRRAPPPVVKGSALGAGAGTPRASEDRRKAECPEALPSYHGAEASQSHTRSLGPA